MPANTSADVTAKTFVDFVNLVESLELVSNTPIFLGQAIEGNLLPGIARLDPSRNTLELERSMLKQFYLLAANQILAGQTELDLLVLAQHHGLRTRLLDWTSNPLAALWFACSDRTPGDVFVYALDTKDAVFNDPYTKDPFTHGKTKVFQPRLSNERIVSQQGWFTLHCFSNKNQRWVPLEKNTELKMRLITIEIPAMARAEMLKSISRHGTSARTLFPDLDGICRHINWLDGVA